ncbi:1-acyl-sn-glycerol-3-phosphate acyltransferase [Acidovorax sp. SRB_14]|uniref:lysophospholipid acyltransferase family protein n=1 Tax=Acidovorax sp. SRB_14 TaxID=1962699 RepID=UPI001563C27B|nr:lysophospholipid acyltransferase family protein [Acidovorax sp. SRB_14]NMM80861.1 1-acyl-sn-glycerol-3-phosphate acyltransferase [Acidovorax sp. SRB_14]
MLERLNRAWRIVATGLCFSVFGLGGLVLRCVFFPALMLSVRQPARRQELSQAVIHHSFRWFVALMQGVGVLSFEVSGMERLQRRGQLILANHPSLIDVVFLISFVRHADCIVRAALARNPFTGGPIRAAGFITNNGGAELLQDCLESLQAGNNLIIFPEGTRTPLQGSAKLQRGAAHVAVKGRVDITPVHIHSSLPMLTKGMPWWQVPLRKPHFTIQVRQDIAVDEFCVAADSESLAARHVTAYLSEQLFREPSRASI